MTKPIISIRNITKRFGPVAAVDDVSFDFDDLRRAHVRTLMLESTPPVRRSGAGSGGRDARPTRAGL